MQKKRNTYLAILLAILAMTSMGLMVFTREDVRSAADRDYFKVIETEKVDRVVLGAPTGSVELKFENNRWRINEKWDADVQMIKVLFATLRQVEPRRPVAARMKDSVVQWLAKSGIRVTIFEGNQTKQEFLVGGNDIKTEAWFLKAGDEQPYLMMIPGYRVYVAGIFELPENGWRNKRVFDFNWRNFRSLTATYSTDTRAGFEVEMKGRYFGISNMAAVDTAKLNSYLDAMSLLFATRFVSPDQPGIDSVTILPPMTRIEIKDIAGRSYGLELFPLRKKNGEIIGRMADGQLVALDRRAVGEIVKKRSYFVP